MTYPLGTGETANSPLQSFSFILTYNMIAKPSRSLTASSASRSATYDIGINKDQKLICCKINTVDSRVEYRSPAKRLMRILRVAKGQNGPPRLFLPNRMGRE